jgi:hypothetical protein
VTVIDMNRYRTLPCVFCLCDVPRQEFDAHKRECGLKRSRSIHPSTWTPGA